MANAERETRRDHGCLESCVRSLQQANRGSCWRLELDEGQVIAVVERWEDGNSSTEAEFERGESLGTELDEGLYRLADGHRFVIVPGDTGLPSLGVACEAAEASLIEALLRQAIGRWEIERRLDELESSLQEAISANDALVLQVSDDFEELTFLKSISESLESHGPAVDPIHIAEALVVRLRQSARAESMALVVPDEYLGWKVASLDGELPVPRESLAALVGQLTPEAQAAPLVLNDSRAIGLIGIQSMLIVRVVGREETFGYLVAVNRQHALTVWCGVRITDSRDGEFGTAEATTISSAAAIFAAHWQSFKLLRQKEELLTSVIRALVSAIDAKDPYTRGHSDRVALYAARVAKQMELSPQRQEKIYLTGLLHDIGKIAISDATLRKPGRLDDQEFTEIKKHPDEGWAILQGISHLQDVIPGVLYHHERIDGQGYPDGLIGNQIPLEGRILAVVDAFDAMTSDRPYRKGMPFEQAIEILRAGASTQWDCDVLDAFDRALPEIERIARHYTVPNRPTRVKPVFDQPLPRAAIL